MHWLSCRYEFFNDLYHRFLLTTKVDMKCMCLQAMSIVYGRYYEDIGPFSDTKYIVGMLERVNIELFLLPAKRFSSSCFLLFVTSTLELYSDTNIGLVYSKRKYIKSL